MYLKLTTTELEMLRSIIDTYKDIMQIKDESTSLSLLKLKIGNKLSEIEASKRKKRKRKAK